MEGRERAIVNQTNIGTFSKATLGKRLRDGVERIWAFQTFADRVYKNVWKTTKRYDVIYTFRK